MGSYVLERFRPELYTIGLYMNRGTAAFNDRSIYAIDPAPAGQHGMGACGYRTDAPEFRTLLLRCWWSPRDSIHSASALTIR